MGRSILIGLIRFYRAAVSPLLPASCRYVPTCSEYAETAIRRHGALRGAGLAARRLLRCQPFGGEGWDPVPGADGAAAGPGGGGAERTRGAESAESTASGKRSGRTTR